MSINQQAKASLDSIASNLTASSTGLSTLGSVTTETPLPAPAGTFVPKNFKGVNISGAENQYPSSSQFNYIYPQNSELDYFASKGMGLIRMPVLMRRLQPQSYGVLDPIGRTDEPAVSGSTPGTQTNLVSMKRVIDHAFTLGMYVVIDAHNFGTVSDTIANQTRFIGTDPEGTAQFCDWWARIATVFKNYPNVIFGLMNEPHVQSASDWKTGAVAAINAIAAVTTAQWVFIPGTSWTGGHSWVTSGNSAAWAGYVPPVGLKTAFEVHEYLDGDFSGTHAVCANMGSAPMVGVTAWARSNNVKLFVGEIGWSVDPSCPSDAAALMSYFTANSDVYLGWAYWLGGSAAFYSTYMFSVRPNGTTDAPQMAVLTANLSGGSPVSPPQVLTLNPLNQNGGTVVSNGNRTAAGGSNIVAFPATKGPNKIYFEVLINSTKGFNAIGLVNDSYALANIFASLNAVAFGGNGSDGNYYNNNAVIRAHTAFMAAGSVFQCCWDQGAQLTWAREKFSGGTFSLWNASATADPVAGVDGLSTSLLGSGNARPALYTGNGSMTVNFSAAQTVGPIQRGYSAYGP